MYRGFFINLDRNEKRRACLLQNLADTGLSDIYERVPAVDGRALGPEYVTQLDRGNLGLWLTREQIMQANLSSNLHLHVMEDDVLLPPDARDCFTNMLETADRQLKSWDLIFTEVFLQLDISCFQLLSDAREKYRQSRTLTFVPLKNPFGFAGTTSIFFNRNSIGKHLDLIAGNWREGTPIDIYLRSLVQQGALDAYVTMPFLTSLSQETSESDILGPLDLSRKVLNLYRISAYKDADLPKIAAELRAITGSIQMPDYAGLFLDAARFMLSDR
jgi:GR25 family glycosyltransferase involved in LPS biosynthesis